MVRNQDVVSTEDYFAARDVLFERGLIGRERGRGGQVFRIAAPPDNSEPPEFEEEVLEATLMAPLRAFLEKSFSPNLDLPPAPLSDIWIADTSQPQGRKGIWLNPDFILVSATRFRLVPDIQLDVHAFELKPTSKPDYPAVCAILSVL